jgi:hypothetical protein
LPVEESDVAGQAQLFVIETDGGDVGEVDDATAPRVGGERLGAVVSNGCEGVYRVHELAPRGGYPTRARVDLEWG